ncbi:site-specific integrase [Mediterranea massiliensis]|uniref:site-specific integrase n=1 Tax=Mediterranea massiliensis TaxID=1841865 RepID=UPI0023F0ADAC|nr:site-specific integrase [Mediterranea massiliensis]
MDKIVYNLVYNRKKSLNGKGTALVQIEAYLNQRKKYFSTKVYLKPEQWDRKRQLVKNHPNSGALNWWLHECIARIEKVELDLWQQGKPITLEIIRDAMRTKENVRSFLTFYEREVSQANLKESSRRNHLTTLALLKAFKAEVEFSEVTFDFVCAFEQHLRRKGYHINTIAKHMKHLKRYVNMAINKELMKEQQYAFRKYKIKTVENSHTHLTPEELEKMEGLRRNKRPFRQRKTLDAFLFCCYTGLRYSDFVQMKPQNLINIRQEVWLTYKSVKTGNEVHLPLHLLFGGKAIAILKEYENDLGSFFRLKDNSNINKELRLLARRAEINKRVSFHTARHTNATLLIYNGVNITTVQKLLGHKSVKTTQVYTNIMDRTIVHDLESHQGA